LYYKISSGGYTNSNDSREDEILDTVRKLEDVGIHSSIDLSVLLQLIQTYRRLTKDAAQSESEDRGWREKLVRDVDTLIAGQKGYIDNFIVLVYRILESTKGQVQQQEVQKLDKAFDMPLTRYMSTPNKHALVLQEISGVAKMIVVHNPTAELREEVERITGSRNGRYAVIFTSDKTVEDDFMGKFEPSEIESPQNTSLQEQISTFVESLKLSPNSSISLPLKIPINEKLLTPLFRGIESWLQPRSAQRTGPPITPTPTPATVVSTFPSDGSNPVPVDTAVTATFSEPVTVEPNSLTLKDMNNKRVEGTTGVGTDGKTLTFNKTSNLTPSTTYIATITGVKDLAGNAISSPKTWKFTTAPAYL
jgi:hypothetical protein